MRINSIREQRNKRALTQKELANLIGISRSHLALIEAGKYNPSLEVAGRLARFLGIPIEELFPWLKESQKKTAAV